MTRRPDFRRALVGLPISLVVLGVFGLLADSGKRPKVKPNAHKAKTDKGVKDGR